MGVVMTKFKIFIVMMALLLILSACGTKITTEEVVNKALEVDVKSIDSNTKVNIEIEANGQSMNQSMDVNMKYIKEPYISSINITTIDGNIEVYMDSETAYMLVPGMEQWVKAPVSSVPEFTELANGKAFKKEMEHVQKFIEMFKLEQNEQEYVLEVNISDSSSDKEKELVKEVFKDALQQYNPGDLTINSFDYTLTLDKDFNLKSADAIADLDVTIDGQAVVIKTKANANYTNVNSVQAFTIPTEITENAVSQADLYN
jgi:hypothetical protein